MPKFDPMTEEPQTDEQAKEALRYGKSELMAVSMVGIYQCRRAQGDSILDAYEAALLAAIGEEKP